MCFHVFSFSNNNTKSCTANDFLPYKHMVPLHVIIKLCWMKWAWVLMPVSPEFKSYFCQLLSTWTWSKLPKFFEPKLLHLQNENNTSLLSCCEEILGWCRILGPLDFPGGSPVKNYLQCRRCGFDPWVGNIPWQRKWQPTPVFLPGKSHGQRSLVDCSPWGHKRVRHNWAAKRLGT